VPAFENRTNNRKVIFCGPAFANDLNCGASVRA
jgi:hypothetical protein